MLLPANLDNDYTKVFRSSCSRLNFDKNKCWAHIVTPQSCPQLHALYKDCLEILDIDANKIPPLIIYESANDALDVHYARGLSPAICMSRAYLKLFEPEHIKEALGHEMGHHKHSRRQFLRYVVANAAALGLGHVAKKTGILDENNDKWTASVSTAFFAIGVGTLLNLAASRRNEYEADRCAIDVVKNPEITKESFELYKTATCSEFPESLKRFVERVDFFTKVTFGVLSTHPPYEHRVAAAKKYAEKKGYIKDGDDIER